MKKGLTAPFLLSKVEKSGEKWEIDDFARLLFLSISRNLAAKTIMSFQGAIALTLDAKGRLAIPARHRGALSTALAGREADAAGGLILTAHPHKCLLLYPEPAWAPIRDRILQAPSFDTRSAALKRVLIGNAREEGMDSAGRLLIAPELREFAGLERKVWMVGLGSHFELWSDAGWQAQNAAAVEVLQSAEPPAGFGDFAL